MKTIRYPVISKPSPKPIPTEGKVYINDNDITDLSVAKRNIGIVFQSYALFPNLTVRENVAYGLKFRRLSREEAAGKVDSIIEKVGLHEKKDAYPAQLSGGQQQRVALDAKVRNRLRSEVRMIQRDLGVTTSTRREKPERARPSLPCGPRRFSSIRMGTACGPSCVMRNSGVPTTGLYFNWRKPAVRRVSYMLSLFPLALPGLVIGISYIFFFNARHFTVLGLIIPNPLNFLYGTVGIIVLSNIIHFYSVNFLAAVMALRKLDKEIEEVSQSLAIPFYHSFARVTLPVNLFAVLELFAYFFVNSMATVSAVIFLYNPKFRPASVLIVNMDDAGDVASVPSSAFDGYGYRICLYRGWTGGPGRPGRHIPYIVGPSVLHAPR